MSIWVTSRHGRKEGVMVCVVWQMGRWVKASSEREEGKGRMLSSTASFLPLLPSPGRLSIAQPARDIDCQRGYSRFPVSTS